MNSPTNNWKLKLKSTSIRHW